MEFAIRIGSPEKQRVGSLIVAVHERSELSTAAQALDDASKGALRTVLERSDIEGKVGQTLLLHSLPGVAAARVLLVGAGPAKSELSDKQFLRVTEKAVAALKTTKTENAASYLTDLDVKDRDLHWKVRQQTEIASASIYKFDSYKSGAKHPAHLKSLAVMIDDTKQQADAQYAVKEGMAIAKGVAHARDLGNIPPNVCHPTYLANDARALAKKYRKLTVKVLGEKEMERLGMGSFLAVSRGSEQEGKLIIMEYFGAAKTRAPHVLVGKGITFDTGGISLKPGAQMDEMKFDMCGAASVLGTMHALCELNLPINVIGICAAAENMPDGKATRPGDIVKSMSGQTIEILNTDAEGRLVLCDALTYAERYNPATVIDIATLTGACIVALGSHLSGLMANDESVADAVKKAGNYANDPVWQLPLVDEYQEWLDSPFADMANIGGPKAGTITAANFLSRFTKKFKWAHLDIAGTAWKSGGHDKGASGRPVPLLTQYLLDKAQEPATPATKSKAAKKPASKKTKAAPKKTKTRTAKAR